MDITISPQKIQGTVSIIPSKSQAHRYLICTAFSDKPTTLICSETNADIEATADCLRSLGAEICRIDNGYQIKPVVCLPTKAILNCRESGTTLRFMLPIVGALGVDATFHLEGRLPKRPLSPMWEEMEKHGCVLSRPTENTVHCSGQLLPGMYAIDGSISSQFISGLLFALSMLPGDNTLKIAGKIESKPYVEMTLLALERFGVHYQNTHIQGPFPYSGPDKIIVEGDWSNGAFFLAANALNNDVNVMGLDSSSPQGDRVVAEILKKMDAFITVDAGDIPDLVPILAVVAGAIKGATFINIRRLRLKESDRVLTTVNMLKNLGANVSVSENEITVYPAPYKACRIDSAQDHRIAMAAAIAATVASGPVTITDAQCVAKSYPSFWEVYRKLGGSYEQYIW